jgi:hypothetical protein
MCEDGDDMCDICMRSGVAVYRTTLTGDTVCDDDDCQDEADRIDAEYEKPMNTAPEGGV